MLAATRETICPGPWAGERQRWALTQVCPGGLLTVLQSQLLPDATGFDERSQSLVE